MTQEQKEILIKDICCRLPYGVKFKFKYGDSSPEIMNSIYFRDYTNYIVISSKEYNCEISDVIPYLFPISSMTEEQKKEYNGRKHLIPTYHYEYGDIVEEDELWDSPWSYQYLIENHFDCNGLIPLGLAIDCTNLNIY